MKAKDISILSSIENDHDLVVVEKFNGFSEFITIDSGGLLRLFSRSGKEHTHAISSFGNILIPELANTRIAAEGIAPSKRLEDAKSIFGSGAEHSHNWQMKNGRAILVAHDLHVLSGQSLDVEFFTRHSYIPALSAVLKEHGLNVIPEELINHDKEKFFEHVVASGGEGVVVKKLSGSIEDWFKVKKIHTWDVIITGFTMANKGKTGKFEGLIGAVKYGFWDSSTSKVVEIGQCSGMVDSQRIDFTNNRSKYIGKVMEVKGQELGRQGGIMFPRFVRIREDKLPNEC